MSLKASFKNFFSGWYIFFVKRMKAQIALCGCFFVAFFPPLLFSALKVLKGNSVRQEKGVYALIFRSLGMILSPCSRRARHLVMYVV